MGIGKPWIKDGVIDRKAMREEMKDIRFSGDAISLVECFNMIADRINEAEEAKDAAKQKVKEYEENINADVRVQELTAKLKEAREDLYRGFRITEQEELSITKWKKQHDIKMHGLDTLDKKLRAGGAIGGRYHYAFYPTSIGIAGDCICGKCESQAFAEAKGDKEKYKKLLEKYDATFEFSEL